MNNIFEKDAENCAMMKRFENSKKILQLWIIEKLLHAIKNKCFNQNFLGIPIEHQTFAFNNTPAIVGLLHASIKRWLKIIEWT